ncbi:MAG: GNAT family protein [Halioglobus sp.]
MLLKTQRLELHPIDDAHAEILLDIFRNAQVRRYLLDDQLVSPEWVQKEIRDSKQRFLSGQAGLWILKIAGKGNVAGFAGFRDFLEPPRLQLLYGLLPEFWGQGLALEAARRLCEYGFSDLNFERIEAAADTPNLRSIQVLERMGMSRVERNESEDNSMAIYELTRY